MVAKDMGESEAGESTEAVAIRETFEETDYPCQIISLRWA